MFNTSQQEYIKTLVPTFAKEGYKYYVAYSDSLYSNNSYSSYRPDLYVLFSKKAISARDAYTYDIQEPSILVSVRSYNYSSYGSANNSARVTVVNFTQSILNIEPYEHIYTNAEFQSVALQPDYNLISGGETNVRLEAISFVLLVSLIISLLSRVFRFRR